MTEINLRNMYPQYYKEDLVIDVCDSVLEELTCSSRAEKSAQRLRRLHHANAHTENDEYISTKMIAQSQGVEALLEAEETKRSLYDALGLLTTKQRSRIIARFFNEHTLSEIAQTENVSISAIDESIKAGIARLHEILNKLDGGA